MQTEVKNPFAPDASHNISFVGHSDQGGNPGGVQVMVNKDHAFVGNAFDWGVSVIDVRDPRAPKTVKYIPAPKNTWTPHLQAFDDLLLVVEEFNFYSIVRSESEYYGRSIDNLHSSLFGVRGRDYSAGLRIYDISDRANPRAIGFMEVEGLGLHRVWWVGGRYAYAAAMLDGFTDHILISIDLQNPTQPREVGRWWLPGMNKAAGEVPTWTKGRMALHHAVVADNVAYASWRDAGLVTLAVDDPSNMKMIAHRNWSPPFAGGTHSALPLHDRQLLVVADEAVADISEEPMKHTWVLDIREPTNPVTIATMPIPSDQDYVAKGGHFGPHNLWENRPDAYVSSTTIFATYQSAGLRIFDINNPFRPTEIAYFVPPPPDRLIDKRPGIKKVIHSADVYVQPNGLMYLTDYNAGLYILQWDGI